VDYVLAERRGTCFKNIIYMNYETGNAKYSRVWKPCTGLVQALRVPAGWGLQVARELAHEGG